MLRKGGGEVTTPLPMACAGGAGLGSQPGPRAYVARRSRDSITHSDSLSPPTPTLSKTQTYALFLTNPNQTNQIKSQDDPPGS